MNSKQKSILVVFLACIIIVLFAVTIIKSSNKTNLEAYAPKPTIAKVHLISVPTTPGPNNTQLYAGKNFSFNFLKQLP